MERSCPEPLKGCPYEFPFSDDHHVYFPGREYQTPTEKKFRRLECNIIRGICRCRHNLKHLEKPPRKPTIEIMRQAIENARSRPAPEPPHWHNWEADSGDGNVDCGAPLHSPASVEPPPLDTEYGL